LLWRFLINAIDFFPELVVIVRFLCLLFVCALTYSSAICWAASVARFQPLGDLPGGETLSQALGISADGSTVVGMGTSANGKEAFVWREETGMIGLGDLSGGAFESYANAVSVDGSVVFGTGRTGRGQEAFRWSANGGMIALGNAPGGGFFRGVADVSAEGSTAILREFSLDPSAAYLWTLGNGFINLPEIVLDSVGMNGISDDGSVIVGGSDFRAIRWENGIGVTMLGELPGQQWGSATDVSADGKVIVGNGYGLAAEAFRWTEEEGMVGLGFPSGSVESYAEAASADGAVVIGYSTSGALGARVLYWTEHTGPRHLDEYLISKRATGLDGWSLIYAQGISDDGRRIVGIGISPEGDTEAWMVTLPIPEPLSFVLLAIASVGFPSRRLLI
jgi:probable HAF family extracellular repeat protein